MRNTEAGSGGVSNGHGPLQFSVQLMISIKKCKVKFDIKIPIGYK